MIFKPFLDSHDEVIGLMKASHVCVIPSTREGFGIAALEALACGLPVVTVDHPDNAIRELITEETGFLSSLSVEDLAEKIRDALSQYPAMKPACMTSAEAFDWDRIVDDVEICYFSLVGKTGYSRISRLASIFSVKYVFLSEHLRRPRHRFPAPHIVFCYW